MNAAVIVLVRHGAHAQVHDVLCGRTPGVALGPVGEAQARAVARRLSRSGLAAVFSSPVQRAQETAAAIGEASGLAVRTADALIEIDFGAWTGRPFAELDREPAWRRWNEDRGRNRPPGGESMAEVQIRVAGWLDEVRVAHAGETIAAVSHGDVIKAAAAYALGLPLHFHDRFDIAPASMTTIVAWDGGMKLLHLNEAAHD